jgi:hypothetical protein
MYSFSRFLSRHESSDDSAISLETSGMIGNSDLGPHRQAIGLAGAEANRLSVSGASNVTNRRTHEFTIPASPAKMASYPGAVAYVPVCPYPAIRPNDR